MMEEDANGNITHHRKDTKTILSGLYGEENNTKIRNLSINSKKSNKPLITKPKDITIELGGLSAKNGAFNDELPLIQKNVYTFLSFFRSSISI